MCYTMFTIGSRKGREKMKIAVTYADGLVYQHFGHTPAFKIYEVEAATVLAARIVGKRSFQYG